ncbi:MAG TPA: PHP domain-containing protein [Methanoregula sp.]|nr:PHP domain-containing protein [Methanoregula sp.]
MLTCDLHVHTNFSKDGESGVEEILMRAEEAGLDAIAITDHDTIDGAKKALACHSPVLVIPGIEVSTRQGHLLVLGVTEVIPSGLDVIATVEIARRMGAVLILPHPYHVWRHGVARRKKAGMTVVDAIETFNSRYIVGSANKKAARIARRLGKPCVGGSDAHNAKFVGFGRTYIDAEKTVPSILAAIRNGRVSSGGRKTPLRTYTRQSLRNTWRKIKRMTRHVQLR